MQKRGGVFQNAFTIIIKCVITQLLVLKSNYRKYLLNAFDFHYLTTTHSTSVSVITAPLNVIIAMHYKIYCYIRKVCAQIMNDNKTIIISQTFINLMNTSN